MPGQHGPSPSSTVQVLQKSWKSDGCVKIYNSVSARSPLTKSKKIIESTTISKRSCQGTDWLSAQQNGQGTAERFQHSSGIESKSPNSLQLTLSSVISTKPLVCINCTKKPVHDSLYFTTSNKFFSYTSS